MKLGEFFPEHLREELATVFINTEINVNVISSQELKDLQFPFTAVNREYLDHDSFVDCSRLIERNFDELKTILKNNASSSIGQISENDLKNIKAKIKSARTISVRIKKKFNLF